ncbi:hypothetical protein LZ30DRAFT_256329 [Colletotrichum cereale]|nr:hypothetical protein LZ30DRAFT_256329 [Colletotrichum cereale]
MRWRRLDGERERERERDQGMCGGQQGRPTRASFYAVCAYEIPSWRPRVCTAIYFKRSTSNDQQSHSHSHAYSQGKSVGIRSNSQRRGVCVCVCVCTCVLPLSRIYPTCAQPCCELQTKCLPNTSRGLRPRIRAPILAGCLAWKSCSPRRF